MTKEITYTSAYAQFDPSMVGESEFILTDFADELTVHLAVGAPEGGGRDFAVALAWVDGDWRIDVPTQGPFFPTAPLSAQYTPFVQEGAAS